jgi:hypothetical protein
MPRMTAKYKGALATARKIGIEETSALYSDLADAGYQWEPVGHGRTGLEGEWIHLADVPADPPSDLIRVRVWAKAEDVDLVAGFIAGNLIKLGYELVEKSDAYPCRPPKQLESRIYLTFQASRTAPVVIADYGHGWRLEKG